MSLFEKRLLLIALIAHLIAIWCSVGFHHPDEHFQLVEFANYKLGRTSFEKLPWEFAAQIRPGLQPLMAYLLLKPYYALGFVNPYHFLLLLRFLSGMMALFTAWQFHKAIAAQIKSLYLRQVHLALSIIGWGLVYLHVRFSSENWSAISFAWAVICLWREHRWRYWQFGLLAGLSFVFRFQALFMIAGAGIWMLFIQKNKAKDIAQVFGGFMISFVIGLLCERWLYGNWTISSIAYVYQNIVENKAAHFGVEPWYWYFEQIFNQGIPPFSLILLLSIPVFIFYKPKHILTWCMAFFLLGHIVVAHKEFRFLFPLAFFFPYFAIGTLEWLEERLSNYQDKKAYIKAKIFLRKGFWIANTLALILMISKPSNDIVAFNEVLYDHVKENTIVVYSQQFNPYVGKDSTHNSFFANPLIKSYCIESFVDDDTDFLAGKNVLLFSEHVYPKDEFMFQYGGAFFDSSRTSVIYERYPSWITYFDFNDWLKRSNVFTLYQIHHDR